MTRDHEMHQIGEAADAVGLSVRTLRHYEEVGLVPPSGRTQGGFRLYTDDDIDRLRLIKHMKPLEFSLEEMRDLLDVRDRLLDGDEMGAPRRAELTERLQVFAAVAEERCARLREQLESAQTFAETLRREARRLRRERASRR